MEYQILTIAVLTAMSAYFSASETAFSAFNKSRMKMEAEKGNKRAELVLKLADNDDALLSTILIGNTTVNIALAVIVSGLCIRFWGNMPGALIAAAISLFVVLLFGEVSPKSVAGEHPEKIALFSAPILRALLLLLAPLNFLFSRWKKLLNTLFKGNDDHKMTQDELLMLVEEVEQEGTIDEDESNLLRSAIEFTDLEAQDILTHRVDLEAMPVSSTKEELARCFTESRYSRLLLYGEDIDDIVGVLHLKDFYSGTAVTRKSVQSLMAVPLFVHQTIKISDLLKQLQKNKSHLAVVIDEYGGTLGIVTMEDILEELVGDIWDEHDEVEESYRQLDEDTIRISADEPTQDFFELLNLECETEAITIGGWVMDELERIPEEGDSFRFENFQVTITSVEDHRILEVEARRLKEESLDQ